MQPLLKNMKKKIIKIMYWVLLTLLVLIASIAIFSTLDTSLPIKIFSVQTGSMKPTINAGDLIIVKRADSYTKGDIITFYSGSGSSKSTITHRIEDINKEGTYITKGDANSASDIDEIEEDSVIGKYAFRIPLLGHPINFLKTPLGFLLVIVIPSVIISYEEIKKIRNEILSRKKT